MNEIVTFLKSLLSRKFALAVAALITTNMAKIPPKWQAVANLVVVGLYMLANVAEKKVVPGVDPNQAPGSSLLPDGIEPAQPEDTQ